jgi:hypothetical protein
MHSGARGLHAKNSKVVSLRAPRWIINENPPWRLGAIGSTYLFHCRCPLHKYDHTGGELVDGIFLASDKLGNLELLPLPKQAAPYRHVRHMTMG